VIPLLDLGTQYRSIKREIDTAVLAVLESGHFVLGNEVAAFEKSFARYCGSASAVAVNSGTSALHLALLAHGIGKGDEVITVSMTFAATVAAILYVGATPILVDVRDDTWTMDPDAAARAVTRRTRAILPVHLHGRMADMNALMEVAHRHGLVVVEDAAQAHGAEHGGGRAGSMGDIGCFSFYPGKNLGACGEGGAVVTNDPEIERTIRSLRDWGQDGKYNHVRKGFNYRMDEIQAAILSVKMRHIVQWTEARRNRALRYDQLLARYGIIGPQPASGGRHSYHVYAVRIADRDTVRARMQRAGIGTGVHYPIPVHLQPAYADLGYRKGSLPVTEALADEFLSLPIYPELSDGAMDAVIASLTDHR
jgi:dTDP-4-amino-4,6-dideoxygalactose transaminase